jgi:hypothetical protein
MTSVAVTNRGTVTVGDPIPLFETDLESVNQGFDISADGKFIVMPRPATVDGNRSPRRFILVQRWLDEFEHN